MAQGVSLNNFVLYTFLGLVFAHSLAAYSVFGVPLQWASQLAFVGGFTWLAFRHRIRMFPGFSLFLVLFAWAFSVTILNNMFGENHLMMSENATTGYEVYISLRFLGYIFFFSVLALVFWLCERGLKDQLIKGLVNVGVGVSLLAFYVYLAQMLGLPELPRSRGGTGGGEAVTSFTYAFHRAMGTFREPSHLAEWLVVPLFLSYIGQKSWWNVRAFIIATAILLTGSLTGIVGSIAGLAVALLMIYNFRLRDVTVLAKVSMPFVAGFFGFSLLAMGYEGADFSLFEVLWGRVEPILFEEGVSSSNRWYIYEYMEKTEIPIFGQGVGNANLLLGQHTGVGATVSFLNLFLAFAYGAGVIGVVMLCLFMAVPLGLHLFRNWGRCQSDFVFLLGAYMAWLFMFMMHSEELTLFFAVIFALTLHSLLNYKKEVRLAQSSGFRHQRLEGGVKPCES